MEQLGKQVNLEELAANAQKLEGCRQHLGAAHDLLMGDAEPAVDLQAEELLGVLENEITQEVIAAMPSVPLFDAPPTRG
jgi:hypothetical protein